MKSSAERVPACRTDSDMHPREDATIEDPNTLQQPSSDCTGVDSFPTVPLLSRLTAYSKAPGGHYPEKFPPAHVSIVTTVLRVFIEIRQNS